MMIESTTTSKWFTYSVFPQVHVSELQHCAAVPRHVAFLWGGPPFPSVARRGSMTVMDLLLIIKSPPRRSGVEERTPCNTIICVWLDIAAVWQHRGIQREEYLLTYAVLFCKLSTCSTADFIICSGIVTTVDIADSHIASADYALSRGVLCFGGAPPMGACYSQRLSLDQVTGEHFRSTVSAYTKRREERNTVRSCMVAISCL